MPFPPNDQLEITPEETAALLADPAVRATFDLIDCREADEFGICRIEGARLLPLSRFIEVALPALPDKTRPVIVYCHHGMRSARAATWLRHQGHASTFSLAGGIDLWSQSIDPAVPRY